MSVNNIVTAPTAGGYGSCPVAVPLPDLSIALMDQVLDLVARRNRSGHAFDPHHHTKVRRAAIGPRPWQPRRDGRRAGRATATTLPSHATQTANLGLRLVDGEPVLPDLAGDAYSHRSGLPKGLPNWRDLSSPERAVSAHGGALRALRRSPSSTSRGASRGHRKPQQPTGLSRTRNAAAPLEIGASPTPRHSTGKPARDHNPRVGGSSPSSGMESAAKRGLRCCGGLASASRLPKVSPRRGPGAMSLGPRT
jgi:hypothetical protein